MQKPSTLSTLNKSQSIPQTNKNAIKQNEVISTREGFLSTLNFTAFPIIPPKNNLILARAEDNFSARVEYWPMGERWSSRLSCRAISRHWKHWIFQLGSFFLELSHLAGLWFVMGHNDVTQQHRCFFFCKIGEKIRVNLPEALISSISISCGIISRQFFFPFQCSFILISLFWSL